MQTSMTKRSFTASNIKSICLLANSRQADLIGSKIMQNLRRVSGDSVAFHGYGGDWMKKEGFEPTIDFDIDMMCDKQFHTYRKTKSAYEAQFFRWNPLNLVNKSYVRKTDDAYTNMMNVELPKRIYQARPDLILNIDNEYMTFLMMDQLKRYYGNGAVAMPQRHYLNRFVRDMRSWTEQYVDFMHYTVPIRTAVGGGYEFPSEYMGQYGVYEAVRHIYNSSKGLKHLVSDDQSELHVSKRYFSTDAEKAIQDIRSSWRAANDITDDSTVIFYAAGNEVKEAQFTAEASRKGIREFLLKYSAPTSLSAKARPLDNFVTVISTHAGSLGEQYIMDYVRESEWMGKVVFVNNEDNEHLNAMCASDFGIIYDGQMVSSAAACHLPTMNAFNMRMHDQFYHGVFNRWWNDMNIIADNQVYPEMIGGEVWFGKIADTLGSWYLNPDTRYKMIRNFDGFVQEAMSYKPVDRTQVQTRDIILNDGRSYDVYVDPFTVATNKIWADMQAYELKGDRLHSHDAIRTRVQMM